VQTPERRRPRQGLQCAISNSSKCSSDLEPPEQKPNHGGKLFFYEANIFHLMLFPEVSSSLWVPVLECRIHCRPQSISQLQNSANVTKFPLDGELGALVTASDHDQLIDNPT
jgi:hypothetical protein